MNAKRDAKHAMSGDSSPLILYDQQHKQKLTCSEEHTASFITTSHMASALVVQRDVIASAGLHKFRLYNLHQFKPLPMPMLTTLGGSFVSWATLIWWQTHCCILYPYGPLSEFTSLSCQMQIISNHKSFCKFDHNLTTLGGSWALSTGQLSFCGRYISASFTPVDHSLKFTNELPDGNRFKSFCKNDHKNISQPKRGANLCGKPKKCGQRSPG